MYRKLLEVYQISSVLKVLNFLLSPILCDTSQEQLSSRSSAQFCFIIEMLHFPKIKSRLYALVLNLSCLFAIYCRSDQEADLQLFVNPSVKERLPEILRMKRGYAESNT